MRAAARFTLPVALALAGCVRTSPDRARSEPPSTTHPTPRPPASWSPNPIPEAHELFRAPIPPMEGDAPATRYANLAPAECQAELEKRKLRVRAERRSASDIVLAVRVKGHMNRVVVRKPSSPSPFGLLDCRLALALDDLTKVLAEFDVIRLHIGSLYREGARIAHSGHKSQHALGLAMDILSLRIRGGPRLVVERDWHAGVGEPPCGPDAVMHAPDANSVLLRNVVCEVARRHIFHVMLTPSANGAHHDHFHFDIAETSEEQTLR